jgi:prepilin-type N-terminal cleavage/methylation domain-containing protein
MPLKHNRAFTMIELLMVIMLIAILGSTALPQFLDFREEGRISTTTQTENSIRSGIKLQMTQSTLRCNNTALAYPPLDSITANDITAGATPICTVQEIPSVEGRRFVSSQNLPPNPLNGLNTVSDCIDETVVGWCYDANTGEIYAFGLKDTP